MEGERWLGTDTSRVGDVLGKGLPRTCYDRLGNPEKRELRLLTSNVPSLSQADPVGAGHHCHSILDTYSCGRHWDRTLQSWLLGAIRKQSL